MLFSSPVKWKREEQLPHAIFQAVYGSSFLGYLSYNAAV